MTSDEETLQPNSQAVPAELAPELRDELLPAPLSGEVLPAYPEDYDYYEAEPPEQAPLLRNPYILAGLSVAAAIVLAVVVVVIFGSSGGGANNGSNNNGVLVDPLTPVAGRGVKASSIATSTVREGPAIDYLEIGTLRANQDVEVIGRNQDATWFQIYYPFQSQLKGWVPASALRVPSESIQGLPVVAATPIPRPTVLLPTATPFPTDTPMPTATVTATPGSGVDLQAVALNGNCQAGSTLVLQVSNVGGVATGNRNVQITVTVNGSVVSTSSYPISLEPNGPPVVLSTNQTIQGPRTTAQVVLLGTPQESNVGNNTVDCVVAGGGPGPRPTDTPKPGETPKPTNTPKLNP